jgi:hypothetical protein
MTCRGFAKDLLKACGEMVLFKKCVGYVTMLPIRSQVNLSATFPMSDGATDSYYFQQMMAKGNETAWRLQDNIVIND